MTNSILTTPTASESSGDCRMVLSRRIRPLTNRHSDTIGCNCLYRTPVVILFDRVRPLAVCLAVVAVVVDAIKRMQLTRPSSHVAKKHGEIAPALTVRYSPSTVMFKSLVARVVAAIFHRTPCAIFGLNFTYAALAMSKFSIPHNFSPKATAACGLTTWSLRNQGCAKHRYNSTAFAFANPSRRLPLYAIERNYSESSEFLTRQVVVNHHNYSLVTVIQNPTVSIQTLGANAIG